MAEANEKRIGSRREIAATNLSLFPRDLLQRFIPSTADAGESHNAVFCGDDAEEEEKEVELNLGLSLGGRFGIDKSSSPKKLTRWSSIVGTMPILREEKAAATPPASASYPGGLIRTMSLPTETEEEWRKRKETQTLRRMEAKRKRSEKQRNNNTKTEANLDEVSSRRSRPDTGLSGLPRWAAATSKGGSLRKHQGGSRQGSVESQGGGGAGSSSSVSELESKPVQASNSSGELRIPIATQPSQEETNQEPTGASSTKPPESTSRSSDPLRRLSSVEINQGREKMTMEEMPCVFTKGEGPNGRRVDGILYRYGKGEEVRIMCVCHGSFLSPAEFVKHAGGGDVDHPLRHIVVNTSAASSL